MKIALPCAVILSLGMSVGTVAAEMASSVVTISNAKVVAEAVNSNTTAIYMNLDNKGTQLHSIVAATSQVAKIVQLHETYTQTNGHSLMKQVPSISITPHSDRPLEDGTFHIMLIDTKHHLNVGQTVPVTMIFEDGSWISVNARVQQAPLSASS